MTKTHFEDTQKRETMKTDFVPETVKRTTTSIVEHAPTHRYFCDACTGVAGVSNIPEAVKQITCAVCGKTQICKKENWIAL